jgi:hypothetical protein
MVRERRLTLRLTDELLDVLGGGAETNDLDEGLDPWPGAIRDAGLLLRGRRAAQVRTQPDPLAWAAGVVQPELLVRGPGAVFLVCGVRSAEHAGRLVELARGTRDGEPLLFVGEHDALAPLRTAGAQVLGVRAPDGVEIADGVVERVQEPVKQAG